MSKVRDKGFSIIEILIAVAVMTILISPIIAQVFQTVQTSARAKETQYVIDNADLVLEYFRSNSIKDLAVTGDKNDAVTVNSVSEFKNVDCDVYIGGSYFDTVQYDVTDYELAQVQLGREKNHYTRVVSMDDLTNKLGDNRFQSDFIGNLVNIIARHKNELIANGTYENYKDQEQLNGAFDAIRQSPSSNFSRMIKLSVTGEDVVGSTPSYYKVICEVYYKAQYTFLALFYGYPLQTECSLPDTSRSLRISWL